MELFRVGTFVLFSFLLIAAGGDQTLTGNVKVKTHDSGVSSSTQYILTYDNGENRVLLEFGSTPVRVGRQPNRHQFRTERDFLNRSVPRFHNGPQLDSR